MMEFYTTATPNGRRVSIMLEECGFPYRAIPLDFTNGETSTPEFLMLNPLGMLPVLVDPDGPGGAQIVMTQSATMVLYLAEKARQFIPSDPRRRLVAMQWFMMAMTDAAAASGSWVILNTRVGAKPAGAIDWFRDRLLRFFGEFDRRLGEADYLADEFSIADIALYPIVLARAPLIRAIELGNLKRWAQTIGARPGVSRGAAVPP